MNNNVKIGKTIRQSDQCRSTFVQPFPIDIFVPESRVSSRMRRLRKIDSGNGGDATRARCSGRAWNAGFLFG